MRFAIKAFASRQARGRRRENRWQCQASSSAANLSSNQWIDDPMPDDDRGLGLQI
jgi:hypothetical protein